MGKVKAIVTEVEEENRVSCAEAMRILAGAVSEQQEAELHEQAKDFINADRGGK